MRSNKRRDTGPELAVRRALHAAGLRYFVDRRIDTVDGPVRPDIVFPRAKVAVFIDGCFWHGCPEHATMPVRNRSYWEPKLARNVARDAAQTARLRSAGWRVARHWEHEDSDEVAALICTIVSEALVES